MTSQKSAAKETSIWWFHLGIWLLSNSHGCVYKPRVDCSCFEIPNFPKVNNLFWFVYF